MKLLNKLTMISALCGIAVTLSAGPNLLTNGSFENGLTDWKVNKPGDPQAEATVVQDGAADGKQSLNIQFTGQRRSNVYLTVWRSVKLQPLTTYRFSFKAKLQNAKPFWAGLEYKPMVTIKSGTADWQEYSFEFSTENKENFHIRFLIEDQAENIWLDDVRLEKVLNLASAAKLSESILVFGAKPDGSADAAPAFRQAIEAGVREILLPEGTFAVSELVLPDSVSVKGIGDGSRLVPLAEEQKFVLKGGSNSSFANFSIDAKNQKTHGLYFLRARNIAIDRVAVQDSKAFGINFDHVDKSKIENCTITNTHTGIMQTYCSDVRTMQNTVLGSTRHGIQFWSQDNWKPEARTRNLWFCNNYVKNAPSGDGGIWGVGVIGVVMSGNIIEGAKDVGLDLEWCENAVISGNVTSDTAYGGISLFFSCKNVTISGNTVYNNRVYDKDPEDYWVRAGIWLTYPNVKTFKDDTGHENITIAGNTVINAPGKRRAVWIGCGRNILIQGNNLVQGTVYHGGKHGDLKVPVLPYDGQKNYFIDSDEKISVR